MVKNVSEIMEIHILPATSHPKLFKAIFIKPTYLTLQGRY